MKLLLTINQHNIEPQTPQKEPANLYERHAARAVLLDNKNQIFLLHVSKHGYHKLPGGGVNNGEELMQTLERELMEEIGCKAKIIAALGSVIEYRHYDDGGLKQTSYCYLARQIGEQIEPSLEANELQKGMYGVKATSIDQAITLLVSDKPSTMEGRFIQKRDLAFLNAAKSFISANKPA
jgi:ADP-ribose pyrophosphatase YjhB (NUDIX family)